MKNALLPGLGGPMGAHARRRGVWFDPLPWTLLVGTALYVVLVLRQIPCIQTDATNPVNAFIRLCYSDIPLAYVTHGYGLGESPLGTQEMVQPPLLGLFVLLALQLTRWFGHPVDLDADLQQQLDGAETFFAVNAVLLFVFFLLWICSMLFLGRESRQGRYRSWDALLVAASPVVLAAGLINWDLVGIGLSAVGLLLLARGLVPHSGIVLGLAAASATMPIAVVLAVAGCIALRGRIGQLLAFAFPAVASWFVLHLPRLATDPDAVFAFYGAQVGGEASYGSVWFLLEGLGLDIRAAGSLGFLLLVLFLLVLFAVFVVRAKRPSVVTMVATVVFATAMVGAAYSPQTALWLLFALVLARPHRPELVAFTVVQVGYWLAIWGWLAGHLTIEDNGPEGLYFLAIGLRLLVDLVLLVLFIRDAAAGGKPATSLALTPRNGPVGGDEETVLGPDDLVEVGGRHAAGDGDVVANVDARVGAGHEQH